jgi:hypothetical protein
MTSGYGKEEASPTGGKCAAIAQNDNNARKVLRANALRDSSADLGGERSKSGMRAASQRRQSFAQSALSAWRSVS